MIQTKVTSIKDQHANHYSMVQRKLLLECTFVINIDRFYQQLLKPTKIILIWQPCKIDF